MNKFFTESVEAEASQIWKFKELGELNLRLMRQMKREEKWIGMVSGPISTGGTGNIDDNMRIFGGTVETLQDIGIPIYDQVPFERHMRRITKKGDYSYVRNPSGLLLAFYLPIFRSGLVDKFFFIYGWEGSVGAKKEHGWAQEYELGRIFLPKNFHKIVKVSKDGTAM